MKRFFNDRDMGTKWPAWYQERMAYRTVGVVHRDGRQGTVSSVRKGVVRVVWDGSSKPEIVSHLDIAPGY